MTIKIALIYVFLFGIFVLPAEAKVLPRFSGIATYTTNSTSTDFIVSPKLRSDRKALRIFFGNLSQVKNVSYTLTYQGNGSEQGAMGSIDSSMGDSINRELLFGTCSTNNVCIYHSNITNTKLEITIEYLSGIKMIRRYRVKV